MIRMFYLSLIILIDLIKDVWRVIKLQKVTSDIYMIEIKK